MPVGRPKLLAKRTQAERRKQRKNILLVDAAISERTQERYYIAVRRLLPVLEKVRCNQQLDDMVADWVEAQWVAGETLHVVSDALCGLHHFEPYTKRWCPLLGSFFERGEN